MSTNGFKVQVDDLLSVAPSFAGNAQDLTDALNNAVASLQALGSFWGDDKPGTQFAGSYQKVVSEVLLMLAKGAEDLEGISQGLAQMAARYGQTEADIAGDFHRRSGPDSYQTY